jgi:hypothetical protein
MRYFKAPVEAPPDAMHRLSQGATGLQLCLLLNLGKPWLEIKRVAHGYEGRRKIGVFCVHRLLRKS